MSAVGPIETVLRLRLRDQSMIEEPAFGAHATEVAATLAGPAAPYGGLILRGGGQPEIMLSDDLLPLVRALAAGVARLRSGQGALIASFGESSEWAMDHDGTRIVTRSSQPGEPPEPEPEEEEASIDASVAELDPSYYAPQLATREDDAAPLISALADSCARLLALLEGGRLSDAAASRKLTGARDVLEGKQPVPDGTGPRRGVRA